MIIHGRFNRPATIPCPVGDGVLRQYETVVEDGRRVVKVASESSLVDMVNESFADTLIYNILARYERGDQAALNKVVGQYLDVVGMPSTLAQAQQLLIDIRNDFDKMPMDVRQKFNNSIDEFVESVSTGKAAEILKAMQPQEQTEPSVETSSSVVDKVEKE